MKRLGAGGWRLVARLARPPVVGTLRPLAPRPLAPRASSLEPRAARGLSLVAFLVAAVLLSVILIPLFMLFQSSRQSTTNSINYILAAQIIGTQLEKFKAMPFRKLERYIVNPTRPELPDGQPDVPDLVNGPFEQLPELPDIIEEGLVRTGGVIFDRMTYIAYFPQGNPDPVSPGFMAMRQRIRVRVLVHWREPVAGGVQQARKLAMSTLVENENYQPKPTLSQGGTL